MANPGTTMSCFARNHLQTQVIYQPANRIPEFHLILAELHDDGGDWESPWETNRRSPRHPTIRLRRYGALLPNKTPAV